MGDYRCHTYHANILISHLTFFLMLTQHSIQQKSLITFRDGMLRIRFSTFPPSWDVKSAFADLINEKWRKLPEYISSFFLRLIMGNGNLNGKMFYSLAWWQRWKLNQSHYSSLSAATSQSRLRIIKKKALSIFLKLPRQFRDLNCKLCSHHG